MIAMILACRVPPPPGPVFVRRDTPARGPGTCGFEAIRCGDRIEDDTRCGTNALESEFYDANFCVPNRGRYQGGRERVYRLETSDTPWSIITGLEPLEGDLDLIQVLDVPDATAFPRPDFRSTRCDAEPLVGPEVEYSLFQGTDARVLWVVVEPPAGGGGRFRLSVECWPGMQSIPPGWRMVDRILTPDR